MIDSFSKFGLAPPLKIKNSRTLTNPFENILLTSKRKPNLIETDGAKQFLNKIFTYLLVKNFVKRYSRHTSCGAVFGEMFNRTNKDILAKLDFRRSVANWVDVLPTKTKQYKNTNHSSTKLIPP